MDVLRMLRVVTETLDMSRISESVNSLESFQGIMIESYYDIFCSRIHTKFGRIEVTHGTADKKEDSIKSRITYHVAIERISNNQVGVIGPFYLVTHIDGIPVVNTSIDGLTPKTFGDFVMPNKEGRAQYSEFILDCMNKKLIRDTEGIIDKLLFKPESYPELVQHLAEGLEYPAMILCKDTTLHIFHLLLRKNMIVF